MTNKSASKTNASIADINTDLGFILKKVNDKINVMANAFFKDSGMTLAQIKVMNYLFEHENHSATQKEIEVFLNVSHPAASRMVQRLEKRGFVKCEIMINRRIQKTVKLTEAGIKNNQDARVTQDRHEKIITAKMTEEERRTFKDLLAKIYESLTEFEAQEARAETAGV